MATSIVASSNDPAAIHDDAWIVVIPVKPSHLAKSRLVGGDAALARAIALDTIDAAAATACVAEVVVVTADPELTAMLSTWTTVRVIEEGAVSGLNTAIELGLAHTRPDRPRAVLLGDLPALDPGDLLRALALAIRHPRTVVADSDGTGTSLITASANVDLHPRFGARSFAAHRAAGHLVLELPATSGLRRDVDTREQLAVAATLGLGPRTAAIASV